MHIIKQPSKIIFGKYSVLKYDFPENCLLITSKGAKQRDWINYIGLKKNYLFDKVENNPSMETVEKILTEFSNTKISNIIGLGGGSVLDVAKYSAAKMNKFKIMIPTTFGSGSEVTRIAVLKINGKKKSFHDDKFFANISIVDSAFITNTPENVFKNSVIDALAQCSEGYDSKIGNSYTKFLCEKAFDYLESGILNEDNEKIVLGSLFSGLGFGNCSTTLGHALSYVFSNEGIPHGHALAFTTTAAHKFNDSKFYSRFLKIVKKLNFESIKLQSNFQSAADLILTDKKHLDNNPKLISHEDIILLLEKINLDNVLN
jgi:succinate semialdehyde reductase